LNTNFFSLWGAALESVKVWVCPKCGGKQFKLLLRQVVHDVCNRDGDSKPWSYTDATIDSEEVLMVECNSCGEVLERS
jgi:predicted RNA-binding Zn-ribbon protein involved in translation (DUF1610 family)